MTLDRQEVPLLRSRKEDAAREPVADEAGVNLASVMDAAADALVLLDAALVVKRANPAAWRLLGIGTGATGLSLTQIPGIEPHVTAARLRLAKKAAEAPEGSSSQVHDILGARRESMSTVRDAKGGISGYVLTAGDIGDIVEVQRKLDLAMESAVLVWWEWDLGTDMLVPHATTRCILGFALDCIARTGAAWREMVHPEDRDAVLPVVDAAVRGGRDEWIVEHRFRTNAGGWKWVNNQGRVMARDASGRATRMVGTTRDIQMRKEAQERSRILGEALDQSPAATLITGAGRKVEYANAAAGRLLGLSPESMRGKRFNEIISVDMQESPSRELLRELWMTGTCHGEFSAVREDGSRWLGRGTATTIGGTKGKRTHSVCILEDITDARRAEGELTRAKEHAEAASLAKSEFLAVMSHEIRTPLNPILGITQLLMSEARDEDQRNLLKLVHDAGQHLLVLLSDVLDLAKVESGKVSLSPTPVDPQTLVGALVEMRRTEVDKKRLTLTFTSSLPSGYRFLGDERRIRQVVMNLLANAIKFTDRGRVEVSLEPRGAGIAIAVSDTGIGIAEEHLEAIFQPFHQVNTSMSRRFEGAGLGLSICRRLVSLMGGTISVRSRLGEGSTFAVVLPPLSRRPLDAQAPGETDKTPRVMIVEDEPVVRTVVARMLRKLGCRTLEAADGRSAVLMFREHVPDLVLMDIQMPLLDGIAATLEIRAMGGHGERVPIIAQTASLTAEDRERCFAAGMNDFVSKPADQATLGELLRRYVTDLLPR